MLAVFSPSDYTLLHDSLSCEGDYTVLYELTVVWSPLFGGSTFFTTDSDSLIVEPRQNTLTIVRSKHMRSCVKYVNHRGGRRVFMKATFCQSILF